MQIINRKFMNYLRGIPLRNVSYVQGQEPESHVREYFYYIDHQGMLFLDDSKMKNFTSCFKEKKFLKFFFDRLKINNLDRYREFPFLSLCGKERNFVRSDDYPIVFTHFHEKDSEIHLSYNHAGELLTRKFEPEKLYMSIETGRVYHPAFERTGLIGLVRSKLAIELSKSFIFANGETNPPTQFVFHDKTHNLDTEWYTLARSKYRLKFEGVQEQTVEL